MSQKEKSPKAKVWVDRRLLNLLRRRYPQVRGMTNSGMVNLLLNVLLYQRGVELLEEEGIQEEVKK